jgi:hypothetical protein
MSHYLESQARIDEAEAALQQGDDVRARTLYREAARMQCAFIDSIPAERVRTRSIYGLSAATLLFRGGDLDAAERLAHQLLSAPWIELQSAERLRALLTQISTARPSFDQARIYHRGY